MSLTERALAKVECTIIILLNVDSGGCPIRESSIVKSLEYARAKRLRLLNRMGRMDLA